MKRFVVLVLLVFALATNAYGMGWLGGGHNGGGGATNTSSSSGGDSGSGPTSSGSPVAVPEPATMLLLGAGLAGVIAFRRKLRR